MVYRTILDALGNTPLIELNHMTTPDQARIVVKYEGLNVGGSIKTRTALQMIEGAEAQGIIGSDSIIVEPTSGTRHWTRARLRGEGLQSGADHARFGLARTP